MDDTKDKDLEQVDYEEEALALEEKLRTAIQGGAALQNKAGDGGGSW